MSKLVLVSVLALAVSGCAHSLAPGESPYDKRVLAIEPVERLAVNGPFKVLVFGASDKAEVTLFGPPEMLADAVAEIEDGTLAIRFDGDAGWSWNPGSGMHANVHLPKLNSVALNGSGSIDVLGAKADEFRAGTGGSGSITIRRLEADTVQLGVGGAGSVEVEGTANSGQYGVGGAGSIRAKMLRVKTAQIGIGGAGSIYADVSESAEIGIGGAGRVEVVGGAECTFAESQADQIDCR